MKEGLVLNKHLIWKKCLQLLIYILKYRPISITVIYLFIIKINALTLVWACVTVCVVLFLLVFLNTFLGQVALQGHGCLVMAWMVRATWEMRLTWTTCSLYSSCSGLCRSSVSPHWRRWRPLSRHMMNILCYIP